MLVETVFTHTCTEVLVFELNSVFGRFSWDQYNVFKKWMKVTSASEKQLRAATQKKRKGGAKVELRIGSLGEKLGSLLLAAC